MPNSVAVIGGTGQIGRQIVAVFLDAGWHVTTVQRGSIDDMPHHAAVTRIMADRDEPGALDRAIGSGADVLIDVVASTTEHARQLIGLQSRVNALAVVSSASVYCDEAGRTIAEAGFAELPVPVPETQRTIAPGTHCYSARKAALEQALLQKITVPLVIVRPAAVYGPGSSAPREWWFLKRLLDGRTTIPLAFGGASVFHPAATANIAELIRVAVGLRGTRVLNAADPAALSAREIGQAIAATIGRDLRIVKLPGPPTGGVGASPWSLPFPLLLDTSTAEGIGYRPIATYASFIKPTCDWLVAAARKRPWQEAFPDLKPAASSWFDYAREDAILAARGPDRAAAAW